LAVRDKKNYGIMVFWFWVPAHLIEKKFRAGGVEILAGVFVRGK